MAVIENLIKSTGAGIAISIGAIIYLALGGWIGAVFFSIGLYLVLWFKLNLYTGKVGYLTSAKDIPNLAIMIVGNLIGCALCAVLIPAAPAYAAVLAKLSAPLWLTFIKSIICGILIYAAVDQFKAGRSYAPIIAVPAFILCGAEHCIADMCFILGALMFNTTILTPYLFVFLGIVILGNAIGSLLFRAISFDFSKK